jgi:hypothetical protein
MTIRVPSEVYLHLQIGAEAAGTSPSGFAADLCTSWAHDFTGPDVEDTQ